MVEIGCSYGGCTSVLANSVGDPEKIIAIDIGTDCVESTQKANPGVKCFKLDIL